MNNKFNSKSLVQASFFCALSIALTRLGSIMVLPTLRLGFGEIPLMISGIVMGPFIGGTVGLVADLLGFMINPQGVFHLGFTISSMLWGIIPGIITKYISKKYKNENIFSTKNIFITVLISRIIIALGLNTLWLSMLVGKAYHLLLAKRIITSIVQIPIETFIISRLIKHLNIMINFNS